MICVNTGIIVIIILKKHAHEFQASHPPIPVNTPYRNITIFLDTLNVIGVIYYEG